MAHVPVDQLPVLEAEPEVTQSAAQPEPDAGLVVEDLLVEDVSIDGMCGVY